MCLENVLQLRCRMNSALCSIYKYSPTYFNIIFDIIHPYFSNMKIFSYTTMKNILSLASRPYSMDE